MQLPERLLDELTVRPDASADLAHRGTTSTHAEWVPASGDTGTRSDADSDLEAFRTELIASQERLYASGTHALLVIFQALDAAGKDGTIKHVLSGVNPQGCDVTSFKAPSADELSHDFLWRCVKVLPGRGRIGIFNRSYYEDVLVTRVHPQLVTTHQQDAAIPEKFWDQRYEDINAFERHLHREGTQIVKVFLHVSKEEQRNRLLARLDDPAKHWKFSGADLAERAYFQDYQQAYESAITATSTKWAPWFVVPADHKHVARALVAGILVSELDQLDLRLPEISPAAEADIKAAKLALHART